MKNYLENIIIKIYFWPFLISKVEYGKIIIFLKLLLFLNSLSIAISLINIKVIIKLLSTDLLNRLTFWKYRILLTWEGVFVIALDLDVPSNFFNWSYRDSVWTWRSDLIWLIEGLKSRPRLKGHFHICRSRFNPPVFKSRPLINFWGRCLFYVFLNHETTSRSQVCIVNFSVLFDNYRVWKPKVMLNSVAFEDQVLNLIC